MRTAVALTVTVLAVSAYLLDKPPSSTAEYRASVAGGRSSGLATSTSVDVVSEPRAAAPRFEHEVVERLSGSIDHSRAPREPIDWAAWTNADMAARLDAIGHWEHEGDEYATQGNEIDEPARDAIRRLLILAATNEREPAVLLKLLPILAASAEEHPDEVMPILTRHASDPLMDAEVRATAAEVLVESGAWSVNDVRDWLDQADARETLIEELSDERLLRALATAR